MYKCVPFKLLLVLNGKISVVFLYYNLHFTLSWKVNSKLSSLNSILKIFIMFTINILNILIQHLRIRKNFKYFVWFLNWYLMLVSSQFILYLLEWLKMGIDCTLSFNVGVNLRNHGYNWIVLPDVPAYQPLFLLF